MLTYSLVFLTIFLLSIKSPIRPLTLTILFLLLLLFIGLRHEIGGDWVNYMLDIESYKTYSPSQLLSTKAPLYDVLVFWASRYPLLGGIYFVNSISALFFLTGLFSFISVLPRKTAPICLAFPQLILVVSMGYTKQSVAMGFLMFSISMLIRARLVPSILSFLIGILFHPTLLLFSPLFLLLKRVRRFCSLSQRNIIPLFFLLAILSLMVYRIISTGLLGSFYGAYVAVLMKSPGSIYRALLAIMPSLLYLWRSSQYRLPPTERVLVKTYVISSFIYFIIILIDPITLLDRLFLMLTPIQLLIFGYLPAFNRVPSLADIISGLYALLIMLLWLISANHSQHWLPYSNILI